ncbi:restriction endonuclease subunit S [Shewanella xiamenensis]|uniref:restriction endonuclease subunit S n=1 Tax=Shewanella xiamenensis TaxID=332186 RepID=UPI0004D42AE1|nr:restriction endonuclease subunit S [Shewanella xiamenensis]KEK29086.1 putative type I restriction-modification system, S subunit [Shewanella xiamenensis]
MAALKIENLITESAMDGVNVSYAGAISDHLDLWTAAVRPKSSAGRGSNSKLELTGIKKLRELILELAVRGKLVPQDPSDEPASVLLERITAEKARLVIDGKIKKSKALPEIGEEEKPFELPERWEWARLNDLGDWGAGATPTRSNSDFYGGNIPWFKSGELTSDYIFKSEESVTELALSKSSLRYNNVGDVLVAMYGATIGKTAILGVKATTNQAVCACTTFDGFSNLYLLQLLKAYRPRLIGMGAGGAQPNISKDKLIATIVALPPFNEQKRIVSKIDDLMALCDQLEQRSESQLAAHQTLVETLLATLTDSGDADELAQNWARLSIHFDTLFTTEASIDALKQTILQLAVMGKLVPQDPSDEPASALLERIAAEKARLVKEKKIKKEKPLPAISENEKPFELPQGWEWCRFSNLSTEVATGPFGSMISASEYISDGIPLINPSHMVNGKIIEDKEITVSMSKANQLDGYRIKSGDVVMARRGEMGRCALVTERESNWLCGTGSFVLKFSAEVNRQYILLMFQSKWVRGYLSGRSVGSTMVNLNHGILNKLPIMLPPPQEQSRVILMVDRLMALCDQLKSRLQTSQQTQLALAESLVEGALA